MLVTVQVMLTLVRRCSYFAQLNFEFINAENFDAWEGCCRILFFFVIFVVPVLLAMVTHASCTFPRY